MGSELLTPTRLDTNSLFITRCLSEHGISLRAKAVVGDSREDLRALFTSALERADLVVLTGGLGPTDDDVTREVVAQALGRAMRAGDPPADAAIHLQDAPITIRYRMEAPPFAASSAAR